MNRFISLSLFVIIFYGCNRPGESGLSKPPLFRQLSSESTGITFQNGLHRSIELNIFNYMYFFNGSGVGVADFNNDGLMDIYFGANQSHDALYLNKGNLKFKSVTKEAGLIHTEGWTTGISVVDINNDGLMDIYVNQVAGFRNLKGANKFYICTGIINGVPYYKEMAKKYNLDFTGLSTQSIFFDYDLDGDLDMYLMNHSVHENGTFGKRASFKDKVHPLSGDRLYRNDGDYFTDLGSKSNIYQNALGYGLGVVVGDVNQDGWPDLYVANDFHENDYLYINQKDGTFKEELESQIKHTSKFSMGTDMADINNDGFNDIISLDMQPYDPFILKSSSGEDEYTIFNFKLTYGYGYQYARNNLQLNNGNNTFSEIGAFAGINATDWSWSSLFMDFDFDGWNDLFVSNGIPRRMNDIDYVNFRANDVDHKWKTQANRQDSSDLYLIDKIPQIKIPNQFFLNNGNLSFKNVNTRVVNNQNSYSNGAAYADFDNDGDLDIIVNNINDHPYLYENIMPTDSLNNHDFLRIELKGPKYNVNAIGTTVKIFKNNNQMISKEHYPVRGYLSSMLGDVIIGVGNAKEVDSVYIVWPDQTFQKLENLDFNKPTKLEWHQGLENYPYKMPESGNNNEFIDITDSLNFNFKHVENDFNEFNREKLIPFMVSAEGPAVAVGDINGDGNDDIFFGSSKREISRLFVQGDNGQFIEKTPALFKAHDKYEDVDAEFVDVDNDGDLDLAVASGGNEYWGKSEYLRQRIYLNNGIGEFDDVYFFEKAYTTASAIKAADFDGDGWVDFFIASRAVPNKYGVSPDSYLFLNKHDGNFELVTQKYLDKADLGMVTDAKWADIDGDRDKDLIIAVEWDVVKILLNKNDHFEIMELGNYKGWWRHIQPYDYDGDGDVDIIAGNLGLNNRFSPTEAEPVELYVNDFDDNEQTDPIVTYYQQGKRVTLANHHELTSQLSFLKKKYLYAKDFAKATIEDIFGEDKLAGSIKKQVNTFESVWFENKGGLVFEKQSLPSELQLSTLNTTLVFHASPSQTHVLVGENFFNANVALGRYDAGYGHILRFSRNGHTTADQNKQVLLNGQVINLKPIMINGQKCILVVKNNDNAQIIKYRDNNSVARKPDL